MLKFDWLFRFGFSYRLPVNFDIQIDLKMKHP